eukprot:14123920-Ditylum_brightwellii.AAC.1
MNTSTDQNIAPSTDIKDLIKCTIIEEIKKKLPGIISSTVCVLSQTGLADKIITTSKTNAVSTNTGEESAAFGESDTNKSKKPND